jgi:RadC-like JAB domain
LQKLAEHISLIEKAVALATSSDKFETDTAAIDNSIETWRLTAANYLRDLDNPTLVGESRTAILMRMNEANIMVTRLGSEKEQLKAGLIDKQREREAYQGILAWCRKVKEAREELTYQQKRDFLHMLGAVVVVENVKPYYDNLVYHVELELPTIQELMPPALVNWETSSPEDIKATKQLVAAGRVLDIELVDHIIIGHQRFVSLKEHLRWK